jgi:hypothetical protein
MSERKKKERASLGHKNCRELWMSIYLSIHCKRLATHASLATEVVEAAGRPLPPGWTGFISNAKNNSSVRRRQRNCYGTGSPQPYDRYPPTHPCPRVKGVQLTRRAPTSRSLSSTQRRPVMTVVKNPETGTRPARLYRAQLTRGPREV